MQEIAVIEHEPALSAKDIRAQVNLIQEVMQSVMQRDQHYGVVPGCGSKPTLLKPGAEKLMMTFRLAVDPVVEDLSDPHGADRRYRVITKVTSQSTGRFLGAGVGECSSREEKYGWRQAVSDAEYEATDERSRRIKFKRDGTNPKQVATNPADVANTILKMAKKRSLVDAVLTVTAASDIFTQDIEDIPEEILKPTIPQVRPRNDATMVQAADRYTGEPIQQEDGADTAAHGSLTVPNPSHPFAAAVVPQQPSDAPAPSPAKAFCEAQANKAATDEHDAEGYIGNHTPRLAGKQAPPGRFTLDTLHGELTLQYWERPDGLGTPNHSYAKVTYRQSERAGKLGKVFTNNELLSLQWAAPPQ